MNKITHYDTKDKNNEKILVLFKDNSIISNDYESKTNNKEFSMDEFINKINSIKSSKHIMEISNSINLTNPNIIAYAAYDAIKYKSTINNSNKSLQFHNYMINKINCERNPIVNNKLRQTIAIVKWKIYNFMITKEDKQRQTGKNVEYDISIAYWIAILCGLFLYFDEQDEFNFKHSSLLEDVSKPFTVDSFKSL
jgi:hypothetical protein